MNDDIEPAGAADPGTPDQTPPATAPEAVRTQNRIALVATLAVVAVLVVGGAFVLLRGPGPADDPIGVIGATPTPGITIDPSAPVPTPAATASAGAGPSVPSEGSRLGRADATVVIDYWADFQCPFCARFAEQAIPPLLPLIEDGTVALVHRDFAFLGPESFDAAVAVRCADREDRYWDMHDAVYAAQAGENQGAFARPRLVAIGESIGLDGAALEACLDDRSMLVEVLDDTSAGVRSAISSTPTVDVNGTRFTGLPTTDELRAVIDAAVAGASPAPLPTQQPLDDPWRPLAIAGRVVGDDAAPVTVDLWVDYQAVDEGGAIRELGPELRTRIEAGTVRVVRHDLIALGEDSVLAAAAVRCIDAQDGPGWLVHEVLAVNARGPAAGVYTPQNLLRLAAQLGLDVRAFDTCLQDPAILAAVTDESAEGTALGFDTAPTVVVSAGGREIDRFTGSIVASEVLAAMDKGQ